MLFGALTQRLSTRQVVQRTLGQPVAAACTPPFQKLLLPPTKLVNQFRNGVKNKPSELLGNKATDFWTASCTVFAAILWPFDHLRNACQSFGCYSCNDG